MVLAMAIHKKENQVGLKFDFLADRSQSTRKINLIGYPYKPSIALIIFRSEHWKIKKKTNLR